MPHPKIIQGAGFHYQHSLKIQPWNIAQDKLATTMPKQETAALVVQAGALQVVPYHDRD